MRITGKSLIVYARACVCVFARVLGNKCTHLHGAPRNATVVDGGGEMVVAMTTSLGTHFEVQDVVSAHCT